MSDRAGFSPGAVDLEDPRRRVRLATHADLPALADAVSELLAELGATPAPKRELMETARELIDDPELGAVLVAETDGAVVGVLGVSWQTAIRIPGRYGVIQEMWVDPEHRYRELGADLLAALFDLARFKGISRLEVGLPSERFPHVVATESFYANNGFTGIGLRMRRVL
jgi:GNAT superfamily N-acetyltransferase